MPLIEQSFVDIWIMDFMEGIENIPFIVFILGASLIHLFNKPIYIPISNKLKIIRGVI